MKTNEADCAALEFTFDGLKKTRGQTFFNEKKGFHEAR